jgi:acyl carrier protein
MDSKPSSENYTAPIPKELLKHLPARVLEAYQRYASKGDIAAADEVVLAIIKDHVPAKRVSQIPPILTDSSTLVGDLGIDSVSIADALYVLEDVFDVSISNQDLAKLRTIGDLKAFLRSKLAKEAT